MTRPPGFISSHRDGEPDLRASWSNPLSILLTATWFGLTAGLLELSSLVVRVQFLEEGFFLRSRHFVWMVPVSVLAIFVSLGAGAGSGLPNRTAAPAAPGRR
jgi:hypothetical protein